MSAINFGDDTVSLIMDYEEMLIGNCASVGIWHFDLYSKSVCQQMVLSLIQYVSERYLRWTPIQLYNQFTIEVAKKWKLAHLLSFIQFPVELNPRTDLWYIAHLIYPNEIELDNCFIYLCFYKKILSGEVKKFPPNYFSDDATGRIKYKIFLKYAIQNNLCFSSISQLYQFFGSVRCRAFLREHKLYYPLLECFSSPIVAFHESLSPSQRIPVLFNFCYFQWSLKESDRLLSENRGRRSAH